MRRAAPWLAIVLAVWAAVATYVIADRGGTTQLVWETADARHYKWLADSLARGEAEPSSFQLGLPLLLVPFDVVAGLQHDRSVEASNALNPYSIALLAGVVLPAAFCLIGATGAALVGDRRAAVPVALGALAVTFVYTALPPPYASEGDSHFQPLLMLGLVPAVEPLNFLFSAFLCFAIARPYAIRPLALGAAIGFAAMVKETNILLAAVFAIFYLANTLDLGRLLKAVAAALAVYSIQLIYNADVYGSLLFPNRDRQWSTERAQGFSAFVEDRYDLQIEAPARLSVDYLPLNLGDAVEFYAVPLVVLLAASVWLAWRVPPARPFVAFSLASVVAFGLVHLAYIRPGATFRYMQAIGPQTVLLLLFAAWCSVRLALKRTLPAPVLAPMADRRPRLGLATQTPWRRIIAGFALLPRKLSRWAQDAGGMRKANPAAHMDDERSAGGLAAQLSWRWLLAGVAVVLAFLGFIALLSGDGDEKETRGTGAASAPARGCEPHETKAPRAGRALNLGEAATVDVSRDPRTHLSARITVAAVRRPSAITDRFTGKGTFRPVAGSAFVAVVYRFKNVGRGTIKAANSVHRKFVLQAGAKGWSSESPRCPTLSSSFAGEVSGASSPQTDVGAGRDYTTVAVYTVPEPARRLTWVGPGYRFDLR